MKLKAIVEIEFEARDIEIEGLRVLLPLPEHITLAGPNEFPSPRPYMTDYRTVEVTNIG